VIGINVKHVNAAVVMKGVIQHSVADHRFIYDGDEAVTGRDFTPNEFPSLILSTCNVIEGAQSIDVSFNGWPDRNHS